MKRDPFQASDAQRVEAEVVLQVVELALHRNAAGVQVVEPFRVARDAREQPATEAMFSETVERRSRVANSANGR